MLSKTMEEALNEQLKQELYSAYLYLSMAASCDANSLAGFAHWLELQAGEEQVHAQRFYRFILDRGARVRLKALPQPPSDFPTPLAIFEQALAHEQEITSMIGQLYARAGQEGDPTSQAFLQVFLTEQVEEEKSTSQLVETIRMAGDNQAALLMIDRELAQRAPGTQPTVV
jgi:ferritin